MCLNHVLKKIPSHQHVPYQTSTMYQNLYHNKCINDAPTPVPNHASTMHHNMYHMPQPSTMYINTCTIPCTNNVSQPYTIYHITQSFHTPCTIGYIKKVPLMVYLNQVPTSPMDLSHTCVVIYQV